MAIETRTTKNNVIGMGAESCNSRKAQLQYCVDDAVDGTVTGWCDIEMNESRTVERFHFEI